MITPIKPTIVSLQLNIREYVSDKLYNRIRDSFIITLPIDPNGPRGITFALRFIYGHELHRGEVECHMLSTIISVIENNIKSKYTPENAVHVIEEFSL